MEAALLCPSNIKTKIAKSVRDGNEYELRVNLRRIRHELSNIRRNSCLNFMNDQLLPAIGSIYLNRDNKERKDKQYMILSLLLEQGIIDVNQRSRDGTTPLHRASAMGLLSTIRLLLEEDGINANYQADNFKSEEAGKPVFTSTGYEAGHTPIIYTIVSEHIPRNSNAIEVIQLLIKHHSVDINYVDQNTVTTPLTEAVKVQRSLDNMRSSVETIFLDVVTFELIESGANVNLQVQKPIFKTAPLIEASRSNNEVAALFLKYFAADLNISLQDIDNRSALDIARENGNQNMLGILTAQSQSLDSHVLYYCNRNSESLREYNTSALTKYCSELTSL